MAKKARTPPPPRRPVQSPQRRADARDPGARRRTLLVLGAISALGILILGVVLWLSQRDTADAKGVAETMRAAGCTYETPASQGRDHIRDGTDVKYRTNPPASGDHYSVPVIWGAYDEPIEEERAVHNLEHGGIVIQYGKDVPPATVTGLQEFYQSDPNGLVLAPLPSLNDQIALTAWTQLAKCRTFDEAAFEEFRDEFRAKGPEPRRVSDLAPGTSN